MEQYSELAGSVMYAQKGTRPAVVQKHSSLIFIGRGRSACVFRIDGSDKVIKVYFPTHEHLAEEEAEIYRMLAGISYFPNLHGAGKNYIVIDFIHGKTLFDCLVTGLPIHERWIREIDSALLLAEKTGLNPSDIHLRNIFVTQSGNIKIIDVARFRQTKNCGQWADLKAAFRMLYKRRLFPKKLPAGVLNAIAAVYKKRFIPSFHKRVAAR